MSQKPFVFVFVIVIISGVGWFLWQRFGYSEFSLPRGGETKKARIVVQGGEVVKTIEESTKEISVEGKKDIEVREMMITDGTKHSIPFEEIRRGCPGKDCIPSIDDPNFVSPDTANAWLSDDEPGISFSRGETNRFYSFNVLLRHEIVNDTIDGQRVLVTYCPLCLTGIVFDPLVQGERVEFGVSGLLWESNLIMYDRKTDSLWSQVLGEAVVGEMTGTRLQVLSSDLMRYGAWKRVHPNGGVLDRIHTFPGAYNNPYADDYFDLPETSLSFATPIDDRLPYGAFVLGIVLDGKAKAYDVEAVKRAGEVVDIVGGKHVVARYDAPLDVVRIYMRNAEEQEQRLNPVGAFWFSWAAAHPETEVYQ